MGQSIAYTYRLEVSGTSACAWKPEYGRPTAENLERWVMAYAKSLEAGGVNAHISRALGHIPYPAWAKIVRQLPKHRAGEIVAEWQAATFQVYG